MFSNCSNAHVGHQELLALVEGEIVEDRVGAKLRAPRERVGPHPEGAVVLVVARAQEAQQRVVVCGFCCVFGCVVVVARWQVGGACGKGPWRPAPAVVALLPAAALLPVSEARQLFGTTKLAAWPPPCPRFPPAAASAMAVPRMRPRTMVLAAPAAARLQQLPKLLHVRLLRMMMCNVAESRIW